MDSTDKKCLKKTNNRQFEVLVDLMGEHIDLAKCVTIGHKAEEAWTNITAIVNSYGPPEREPSEWKKIWADLKCRIKKKVTENSRNLNNLNGGRPFSTHYLSPLEQNVDKICNLSETVITKQETIEDDVDDDKKPEIPLNAPNNKSKLRVIGNKKKHEIQFKLLRQQVQTQEKIFEMMKMQVNAMKASTEAANRQTEAIQKMAKSTQLIAKALQNV